VPRYQAYLLSTAATGVAFTGRFVLDRPAARQCNLATGLGLALGDVFFQAPRGAPTISYDAIAEGAAYLVVVLSIL
jgi:hypothetical protein